MRGTNKSLLVVAGIISLSGAILTADETYGDFTYTVSDSKVTITGYTGADTSVTIPDEIDGYSVTALGENLFVWNTDLTSVTLPDTITTIGDSAFDGCTHLASIELPEGVTSIGNNAFQWCHALTSFTIPSTVKSIGEEAFGWCTSLASIVIPDGVTSVAYEMFYYCTDLASVTIPDSVTSIEGNAFYYCTSLTSIAIPKNVATIGDGAFSGCKQLAEVTVDSENAAFTGQDGALYDENELALYWVSPTLALFAIPDSVTSIKPGAFEGCALLTSVTLPDNVATIGDRAFAACTKLEGVIAGSGNASFSSQDGALYDKDMKTLRWVSATLTSFAVPDSVTAIGDYAFYENESLASVTIPDGVTSIGAYSFEDCEALVNVNFPSDLVSIGDFAFFYCLSVKSLTVPAGVTSIGNLVFCYCVELERVTFLGNAPTMSGVVFEDNASGFCIYYPESASGYTTPTWSPTGSQYENYVALPYYSNGPDWSDSVDFDTAPGWYFSSWFGWFYNVDVWGGWIYQENHGWQYVYDFGDENVAVYDLATSSWWFTGDDFYPFMYDYANATWYYYIGGATPSRSFYDYGSNSVVSEADEF